MEENKTGEFENQWQAAFSEESIEAPKQIWVELDRALANAELITTKKKIGFYKWASAAAIVFGLALGVYAFTSQFSVTLGENNGELVVQERMASDEKVSGNFFGYGIIQNSTFFGSSSTHESGQRSSSVAYSDISNSDQLVAQSSETSAITANRSMLSVEAMKHEILLNVGDSDLSDYSQINKIPVTQYFLKEKTRIVRPKSKNDKFWAGFDVSSGYFNPNYNQVNSNEVADVLISKSNSDGRRSALPELTENIEGGSSYSVGVNFGMELKKKWSLESGVQYSLLGARTLTNMVLESTAYNRAVALSSEISGLNTFNEIVDDGLNELSVDDIDLNNTFQFISVPMQAGYTVIDSRFNVKINGGIAANLYLGNRLTGSSDISTFEIDPGDSSPYRELTFAGLAGVELGYWLHERVNLTLEPNYQQSLQSLTKSSSNFVTNPTGVGVQAGFKYKF